MARPQPERRRSPSGYRRGPWLHGPIPVIGIVGAIGAGKSSVAEILVGHGAFVLDADSIGHALLDQTPQREIVVARFSRSVVQPPTELILHETINRSALASIVFQDQKALRDLEAILHPAMQRTFDKAISRESRRHRFRAVLLDAAILFEAGWDSLCDAIIFVGAARETRQQRLLDSRGWSGEAVAARDKMQWSVEKKQEGASYHVVNNGDREALVTQAIDAWKAILVSRRQRNRNVRPESSGDSDV